MASVSVEQLTALLDFLELNKELALGYCNRSKEGRSKAKRLWEQCAAILNSISSNCVQKTADQWRIYYNEYKSKLMKKINSSKAGISGTGGGPAKIIQFTPLQDRLYDILGRDVGEPLEGVRHNPLSQNEQVVVEEVELDALPMSSPHHTLPQNAQDLDVVLDDLSSRNNQEVIPHNVVDDENGNEESFSILQSAELNEPSSSGQPILVPTAQSVPRRRRRRRQRSPQRVDIDPASTVDQATERLAAMERMSAEAVREHAQAVHRMALALERLAERWSEPLTVVIQNPPRATKYRRIVYSSDSDTE